MRNYLTDLYSLGNKATKKFTYYQKFEEFTGLEMTSNCFQLDMSKSTKKPESIQWV